MTEGKDKYKFLHADITSILSMKKENDIIKQAFQIHVGNIPESGFILKQVVLFCGFVFLVSLYFKCRR